jgi:hypothetical protein
VTGPDLAVGPDPKALRVPLVDGQRWTDPVHIAAR